MLKEINKLILWIFESNIRTRIFCTLGLVIFSFVLIPNLIGLILDPKEDFKELIALREFIPIFWISYSAFCLPAYFVFAYAIFKPKYLKGRLKINWYLLFCVTTFFPTMLIYFTISIFLYGV